MNIGHKIGLFCQDLFVKFNSFISPAVLHNVEKHAAIKKALFYKYLENIPGDYLEFGVYEGTSLKGAATYWRTISKEPIRFFGFDSFEGMRPESKDAHPFYTTFDFSTEYRTIKKRFSSFPNVKLVKGFFQDTLKHGSGHYHIKKAALVLVDCDLYSSAQQTFAFLSPVIGKGTIFVLDDYFNYVGGKERGVRAAFQEFIKKKGIEYEQLQTYGVGGVVFLVTNVKK